MPQALLISVDEYLRTSFRPDRDFIDGEVQERNFGDRILLSPALMEELIFRVLPLPRDATQVTKPRLSLISTVSLAAFVAAHPLSAWLFRPQPGRCSPHRSSWRSQPSWAPLPRPCTCSQNPCGRRCSCTGLQSSSGSHCSADGPY